MGAHLSDGKMYDFSVYFFIVNPLNSSVEAFYSFDKYGSGKKKITEENFVGSDNFNTADKKPFKYDTLAADWMTKVDAQVDFESFNKDSFTITVSRPKKANYSVDLTFMGKIPDWLSNGQIWPGKLIMYQVKDFNAKP